MLPDTKKKTFMSKNSPMRSNENQFSIFEFPIMQKSIYKKGNSGSLQNVQKQNNSLILAMLLLWKPKKVKWLNNKSGAFLITSDYFLCNKLHFSKRPTAERGLKH